MEYSVWDITVVGLFMVFSVFVILLVIFKSFELFSSILKKEKKVFESTEVEVEEDDEIVAAIMGAISSFIGGKSFKIRKIKRLDERGWVYWRKTGWKGVKKWSRNIE